MPYLTCDDQANTEQFEVTIDGVPTLAPAVDGLGGMKHLWFDVSSVTLSAHTAIVRAKNMWGYSSPTDPFEFTKILPGIPSGIGLEEG